MQRTKRSPKHSNPLDLGRSVQEVLDKTDLASLRGSVFPQAVRIAPDLLDATEVKLHPTEASRLSLASCLLEQPSSPFRDAIEARHFVREELDLPILAAAPQDAVGPLGDYLSEQQLDKLANRFRQVLESLPREYEIYLIVCWAGATSVPVGPIDLGEGFSLLKPAAGLFGRNFTGEESWLHLHRGVAGYISRFSSWSREMELRHAQLLGLLRANGLIGRVSGRRADLSESMGGYVVRDLGSGEGYRNRPFRTEYARLAWDYATQSKLTWGGVDSWQLGEQWQGSDGHGIGNLRLAFLEGIFDDADKGHRLLAAAGWLTRADMNRDPLERALFTTLGLEVLFGSPEGASAPADLGMSLGILVGKTLRQKEEIATAVVEAFEAKERLVHRSNPDEASLYRWDRWGLRRYLEQAVAKLSWARVGHGPAN